MSREDAKAKRAERREQRLAKMRAELAKVSAEIDGDIGRAHGDPEKYGRTIETQKFGGKTVSVLSNGFVQVAGMISSPPPEKLLQIESNVQVTKKTGLGRGLAAVATNGWSLTTPNKRGDIYLTILTDKQTHTLHSNTPTDAEIKAVRALEVAGKSVLSSSNMEQQDASTHPAGEKSIPDQIRDMKALLDEGLVTQEDFDQFKKRLLD